MALSLTPAQWAAYDEDGFVVVEDLLSEADLAALNSRLDDIMMGRVQYGDALLMQLDPSATGSVKAAGGAAGEFAAYAAVGAERGQTPGFKGPSLAYRKIGEAQAGLECDPVFNEFMRRPFFRSLCDRVYGAHAAIAIYRAMVMSKPAGGDGGGTPLPWHQDGGDWWALDRDPLVFVWVALSAATRENGAVQVVRGSHRRGLLSQRGHTLSAEAIDELVTRAPPGAVVDVELRPGQAFVCHNFTVHRSGVNSTPLARRGFSVNFIDARTRVLDPKPPLAGELGRPGTGFPLIMPSPWGAASAPPPPSAAPAPAPAPVPPRLSLFATIAPLLPVAECAEPGRFEAVVAGVVAAGVYAGIEAQVSQILLIGKERFAAVLKGAGLRFIGKIYSSGSPAAVPRDAGVASHPPQGLGLAAHLAVWEASLRECVSTPELRALLVSVSSQGGHDSFHARGGADADAFFARALALEAELGVAVHHETHRGRLLFNPWDAADAVARHPRLRLLGDLSHYCSVCEASCGDAALETAVSRLLPHVRHIHLRVGFAEGPQVPDPRMREFSAQLEGHTRWWTAVFDAAAARGDAEVTATPEFLPPPYCWTTAPLPSAEGGSAPQPIADVAAINAYMAKYAIDLFAKAAEARAAK